MMKKDNEHAGGIDAPHTPGPPEAMDCQAERGAGVQSKGQKIMELLMAPRSYGYVAAPNQYRLRLDLTPEQAAGVIESAICETCERRVHVCGERCTVKDFSETLAELLTGVDLNQPTTTPVDPCHDRDAGQQSLGHDAPHDFRADDRADVPESGGGPGTPTGGAGR